MRFAILTTAFALTSMSSSVVAQQLTLMRIASADGSPGLLGEAIVTLAQQPIDNAKHECCSSQRRNGARSGGAGIENDELAAQ